MVGIEYGLGLFDDRRLEKGGPFCMRRWWRGHAHVSADWRGHAPRRFDSRGSCATALWRRAGWRPLRRSARRPAPRGREVAESRRRAKWRWGGGGRKRAGLGPVG